REGSKSLVRWDLRPCLGWAADADHGFRRQNSPAKAGEADSPKEPTMKRRTLDILFSAGGVALAALFLLLGLVMTSNANFSKKYVRDQLSQQQITFKTADKLTAEEKKAPCLVKYAGQ